MADNSERTYCQKVAGSFCVEFAELIRRQRASAVAAERALVTNAAAEVLAAVEHDDVRCEVAESYVALRDRHTELVAATKELLMAASNARRFIHELVQSAGNTSIMTAPIWLAEREDRGIDLLNQEPKP